MSLHTYSVGYRSNQSSLYANVFSINPNASPYLGNFEHWIVKNNTDIRFKTRRRN